MDGVVILQDAHRRALEIVELSAVHGLEEDPQCKENNDDGQGYKKIKGFHDAVGLSALI